jgi:hypothetical protein
MRWDANFGFLDPLSDMDEVMVGGINGWRVLEFWENGRATITPG